MTIKTISQLPAGIALLGGELLEISRLSTTIKKTAVTIAAVASGNKFTDSGAGFIAAGFSVGDHVGASGFTGNVLNNIVSGTITALTTTDMTIDVLEATLYNDAAGESVTIAKWESTHGTAQQIADLTPGGGGGGGDVEEAPIDGTPYVRQDGAWVAEASGGGGGGGGGAGLATHAVAAFGGSPEVTTKSYNVSSITRTSAGRFRVNFTNPMPDVNYLVLGSSQFEYYPDNNYPGIGIDRQGNQTVNYCDIIITEHANLNLTDVGVVVLFMSFGSTTGLGGGGGDPWYFNPPLASHFTGNYCSSGTAIALTDDTDAGLLVDASGIATSAEAIVFVAPPVSGDWTVTAHIICDSAAFDYFNNGLFLYESATHRMIQIGFGNNNGFWLDTVRTNTGGYVSRGRTNRAAHQALFFRFHYDSATTTFKSYVSTSGKMWDLYDTFGLTSFFTTGPDGVGLGASFSGSKFVCDHWEQSW